MAGENLKEYLFSLGFDVDSAGQQKMKAAIREGVLQANVLFSALGEAAEKFTSVMTQAAESLNNFFWTSRIFKESAANLFTFESAARRVGLSMSQSEGAFKSFATAIATNPGLNSLAASIAGVSGAAWAKLSPTDKLVDFAQGVRSLPEWVQKAYAGELGLDYETLKRFQDPEFIKGLTRTRDIAKSMGVNMDAEAASAHALTNRLDDLTSIFDVLTDAAASETFKPLTDGLQGVNDFLIAHGKDITKAFNDIGSGFKNLDEFLAKRGTPDVQSAMSGTVQDIENLAAAFKNVSAWLDKIASSPAWKSLTGTLRPAPSGNSGTYDFLYNLDPNLPGLVGVKPGSGTAPTPTPQAPPPADNRNLWQKYAPSWLGGKPAPAGKWWTPERQAHAAERLMKEAGLSEQGARALVARWATVESPRGPASVNPISGAFGIEQDLGARKAGIAGDTNFDDQLTHAIQQLNTTESRAARMLRSNDAWTAAAGASQYERAEGYNPATGTDNFTNRVYGAMKNIAIMSPAAAAEALKRFPVGGAAGSLSPFFDSGALGAFSPANGNNITNNQQGSLSQKTTIHVYAADNEEIGSSLSKSQKRLNERLIRDFQSVAVG